MGDILFIVHRVPFPPDRGDKIRSFNLLKHLAGRSRVHVVAFADEDGDLTHDGALANYAASVRIVRRSKPRLRAAIEAVAQGKPVSLTAFAHPRLAKAVEEALALHPIDTIVVFSGQMAQYLPAATPCRVVMDFVDVDSAKFDGYAATAIGLGRWMMKREARLLAAFEASVAARVDASLFVSEAEAALFRSRAGSGDVHAIENGIDARFFDPAAPFGRVAATGPLIVFTGQMDYRPNIEAVTWFADAVLPLIRKSQPDAHFAIVGRSPDAAVSALASREGIIVTGGVADVRGWIAAASVVVAPLKLARGIQNKVLEAMAMARPVVATPAAAEGIDHQGTIVIGDGLDAFACAVVDLLGDPVHGDRIGADARAQVLRRYDWPSRLAPLDALLGFRRATDAAEAA